MQPSNNEFFFTLINRAQKSMATSLQLDSHSFTQVVHPYNTPQKIRGVVAGNTKATGWTVQDSNLTSSKRYSKLQNVQTGSTVHPASCSMGTAVLSWGLNGQGVKLTTHLHLVTRLRMSGAIPLLPLYALMA
jgi:hypothetical protein